MIERILLVTFGLLVANRAFAWHFMFTDVMSCQDLPVTMNISWLSNDVSYCIFGDEDTTVAGERKFAMWQLCQENDGVALCYLRVASFL